MMTTTMKSRPRKRYFDRAKAAMAFTTSVSTVATTVTKVDSRSSAGS